jgi:hypothetical protein
MRLPPAARLALALPLLLATRSGATDDPLAAEAGLPETRAAWLDPVHPRPGPPVLAVLELPAGWASGDAMVLLAGDGGPDVRRHLAEALLEEGAAVLHLPWPGMGGDSTAAALPGLLAAGLRTALRQEGAGLVVAIGDGPAGAALPRAAEGLKLAAAVALGPGRAAVHAGAAPAVAEHWEPRAAQLCALLAGQVGRLAASPPASVAPSAAPAMPPPALVRHDCEAALRPPPAASPARR